MEYKNFELFYNMNKDILDSLDKKYQDAFNSTKDLALKTLEMAQKQVQYDLQNEIEMIKLQKPDISEYGTTQFNPITEQWETTKTIRTTKYNESFIAERAKSYINDDGSIDWAEVDKLQNVNNDLYNDVSKFLFNAQQNTSNIQPVIEDVGSNVFPAEPSPAGKKSLSQRYNELKPIYSGGFYGEQSDKMLKNQLISEKYPKSEVEKIVVPFTFIGKVSKTISSLGGILDWLWK